MSIEKQSFSRLCSGFFMIGSAQSGQTGLRTMIAISGGIWSLIAIIAILLTIKVEQYLNHC